MWVGVISPSVHARFWRGRVSAPGPLREGCIRTEKYSSPRPGRVQNGRGDTLFWVTAGSPTKAVVIYRAMVGAMLAENLVIDLVVSDDL